MSFSILTRQILANTIDSIIITFHIKTLHCSLIVQLLIEGQLKHVIGYEYTVQELMQVLNINAVITQQLVIWFLRWVEYAPTLLNGGPPSEESKHNQTLTELIE